MGRGWKGWCSALLVISALAGCGDGTDRRFYRLTWPGGAYTYKAAQVDEALAQCLAMPGARDEGSLKSLPPIDTVSIEASTSDTNRFEACVGRVPGVRVTAVESPS